MMALTSCQGLRRDDETDGDPSGMIHDTITSVTPCCGFWWTPMGGFSWLECPGFSWTPDTC